MSNRHKDHLHCMNAFWISALIGYCVKCNYILCKKL